jgi:hypothetical protein
MPTVPILRPLSWGLPLLLFAAMPSAQAFCGFFAGKADASLFNEASQVVVARDGDHTVLSMLNDYKGPLSQFALVVPTPVVLKQGDVKIAERTTFERLDAYSSPRLAEYNDEDPCKVQFNWDWIIRNPLERQVLSERVSTSPPRMLGMSGVSRDKALGVTVEAKFTLEEYDIVSLSAKQSNGLETWLHENGYHIPQGASAALKPYINQGMKFFVAKVNLKEQQKTGFAYLRPLQFAFDSEKFMLPMRLGMLNAPKDKAQDLIVFLLTLNGRVESSNYRTIKLPANENLPVFVKPAFKDFYKAMFDNAAKLEDFSVVFTEYFWNMAWCDPCAAQPLSVEELLKAGAWWVAEQGSGNPAPGAPRNYRLRPGGARPAMLTRLHVRYMPKTFPEDLLFTQTQDQQNWQTRYVIHNPYGGSVAECNARVTALDCTAMCQPRLAQIHEAAQQSPDWLNPRYRNRSDLSLMNECQRTCTASKQAGIDAAYNYYTRDYPYRLAGEKLTLARLTGWTLASIDAMPGAPAPEARAGAQHLQLVPQLQPEPVSLWMPPYGMSRDPRIGGR